MNPEYLGHKSLKPFAIKCQLGLTSSETNRLLRAVDDRMAENNMDKCGFIRPWSGPTHLHTFLGLQASLFPSPIVHLSLLADPPPITQRADDIPAGAMNLRLATSITK